MGNVTNDVSHAYSYDAEGRPTGIDKSGNNGTVIYYDAFGRAVTINTNGTYTQILYDPDGRRFALMSGQSVQHYYLPLVAGVQAVYDSTGLKYYRHADWLGSSRLQIDASGNLLGGMAYAPYGETYDEAGTPERSFTGQTQDVIKGTTGIYDFLFRQQASSEGRWLAPDPAGLAAVDLTNPQTWNRYAYVGNNPLSNVDPLGLCGGTWETWDPSTNTVGSDEPCGFLPLDGPGYGNVPVHQVDPSGGGGRGGQTATGNASSTSATGPSAPGTGMTACTAAAAAIGTGVGAVVGGTVGGTAGTLGGGGVCSLFAPGVGTVGCGVVGGEVGSSAGSTWGAAIGGTLGGLVGNILCSNGSAGSTGRTDPTNLQEQLALEQAKSNPRAGTRLPLQMGDPRWPASAGWVKMQQIVNGVVVHYVMNVITQATDDWKFAN